MHAPQNLGMGREARSGLALIGLLACWSVQAAPVGMVTDMEGRAMITVAGRSTDVRILTDIEQGAQVQLTANSNMVVLYLADGSEYRMQGPSSVLFRADRPEVISGTALVRQAAPTGAGPRVKPGGLGQGAIVMRSLGSVRIRLLSASSTLVLDPQPLLQWVAPEPGLRYRIDIADDTGLSLHQARVDGTTFSVPAGLLTREGKAYTWEVTAPAPDGRRYSGRGEFGLAPAPLRAQVAAVRAQADSAVSSQVAFALWLEQQELRDEARKLWRDLARLRPDETELRAMAER